MSEPRFQGSGDIREGNEERTDTPCVTALRVLTQMLEEGATVTRVGS